MPTPGEALAAHAAARAWVEAWSVPTEDALTPDARPAVWGSAVTLRLDGRVVARGSWFSDQGPDPLALWRAAGEAVRVGASKMPVENDALRDDRMKELGQRVTVSLELFGQPVPIPASELALPLAGCSPGGEALVVGVDEKVLVTGVDAQLTRGNDPARELSALASELAGNGETALKKLNDLGDAGFRFARAPVVHLAMPFEGAAPVFLDRGSHVVPDSAVRTGELARTGDAVAGFLRSRLWAGVEKYGLSGDMNAVTGASEPLVAPAFEQAMVAYALLRHAGRGGAAASGSREAALDILRDLAAVEPGEGEPWSTPVEGAMVVGALSTLDDATRGAEPAFEILRVRALDVLGRGYDPGAGFDATTPPGARGLIAWGFVRARAIDPRFTDGRAEACVRAAFRDTPMAQLAAQTPFLVWADTELHSAGDLPSGVLIEDLRTLVWEHQLGKSDLRPIDRDLAGGVVFTRGRSVLPTWQTMRPLAALARVMGDERLTPGSPVAGRVPGELVRVTEGLRFVRQLVMEGDGLFLAQSPDRSAWGVRRAPWDPVLSNEAGAMALITTCEALDSMDRIAARMIPAGRPSQAKP